MKKKKDYLNFKIQVFNNNLLDELAGVLKVSVSLFVVFNKKNNND